MNLRVAPLPKGEGGTRCDSSGRVRGKPSSTFPSPLAFALIALLLLPLPARADWQDGAGADWQRLLEAGRKEGKVVIAGRPDLAVPMSAAFKRDTGITIDYLGGE